MRDIDFLQLAVQESDNSIKKGSSPFGAVVVKDGVVVAKAHNTVVPNCDPTAHAEVNAIRKACKKLGTFDLSGCVLYTSCEPCPMCMAAITWANIKKVFFAADRNDADKIGFRDACMYKGKCKVKMKQLDLDSAVDVMNDWYRLKNKKLY